MNIKILIAACIVAIVLAVLSFFADITTLFPTPLAVFSVALISGCLTSFWVHSADDDEATAKQPNRQRREKRDNKSTKPTTTAAGNGPKEMGSVKWFSASKGFGFITRDNGEDIFVHFRSILGKGHRILREGQRVEFAVTEGSKGLQAEDVSTVKG